MSEIELIQKWFKEFANLNPEKNEFINEIAESISENGFNEIEFDNRLKGEMRKIENQIIQEKFQLNPK